MRKNSGRRVGTIRVSTCQGEQLPHQIRDITINNINLYNEMKELNINRDDVFEKYEEIIKDLEEVIRNLEQKNMFINEDRLRLMRENARLRLELDSARENCYIGDSTIKKQVSIFQVVPDENVIT